MSDSEFINYITLKEHFDVILRERDLRYKERWDATETAIVKSEQAIEKRFESVNEFRAQLSDQTITFLTRKEYDLNHKLVENQVSNIQKLVWVGLGVFIVLQIILGAIVLHYLK
jgi:hypothetical protein